jgi:pyruvate/2-oxoglutarate dehydrogenase complex dihydrolipoamide acyltransferase (E2) component
MIYIKVPTVGESISEVTFGKMAKEQGEYVERDEYSGTESETAPLK